MNTNKLAMPIVIYCIYTDIKLKVNLNGTYNYYLMLRIF